MKSTNEHSCRRGRCCCKFWRPIIPPAKITCVFLLLNNYLGKVIHLLGQKLKRKLLLAPVVSENPPSTIQDAVIKLRWERPFTMNPAVSNTAQVSIPRLNPQETLPSHSQEQSPLVQAKMKEEKENSNNFSINDALACGMSGGFVNTLSASQSASWSAQSSLCLSDYHQNAQLSSGFYVYQHKGCLQIFCSLPLQEIPGRPFYSSEDTSTAGWVSKAKLRHLKLFAWS